MAKRKRVHVGPARPAKRRKIDESGKVPIEEEKRHSTVKLGANAIFKEEYADALREMFFERSFRCSQIAVLGSLHILSLINSAVDNSLLEDLEENNDFSRFFTESNGTYVIRDCFNAVTQENIENKNQKKAQMMPGFRDQVEEIMPDFRWPSRFQISQPTEYMIEQYEVELKNNLFYHCEKRVAAFLRAYCYNFNKEAQNNRLRFDNDDIKNAKCNLMKNLDWTDGDELRKIKMNHLVDEVISLCGPSFVAKGYLTLQDYIEKDWFESLRLFILMQRYLFIYNNNILLRRWIEFKKPPNKQQPYPMPTEPMPPRANNFTVIPLKKFKLHHIRFDHMDLISALGTEQLNVEQLTVERREYYKENKDEAWGLLFDLDKIKKLHKHSQFHHQIMCDSVSASVLFKKPKPETTKEDYIKTVKQRYINNEYKYLIPIDPGKITQIAGIRHNVETGAEENFKISSKSHHWATGQGVRKKMGERMSEAFKNEEQTDRERYPEIPSPRGHQWQNYVEHRLQMFNNGMATYGRRKYARLSFEKYIEANRRSDEMAKFMVKHKKPSDRRGNERSLVIFGAANMPYNAPFGIKNTLSAPDMKRLEISLKKLDDNDVMRMNEDYTSQTCANCHRRFPVFTRKHRFKVCRQCPRNAQINGKLPPQLIVTKKSKKALAFESRWGFIPNGPAVTEEGRLMSPRKKYSDKTWLLNLDADNAAGAVAEYLPRTIVWHRDIVAARCILYKGR